MKFTFFILTLSIIIVTSCKTQNSTSLQLINATQKSWVGGTPQSGNKINLLLKLATEKKVVIEHLWIDGKEVNFEIQNYSLLLDRTATKGDTIDISYTKLFKQNETILNLTENGIKCPFEGYKIVVRFDVDGKKRFLKTNEIKTLPKVNYP